MKTPSCRKLALNCACAFVLGCGSLPQPGLKQVAALVVVLDLSTSASSTPTTRCDELGARVRQALSAAAVRRLDVLALGTGDASTGTEPIVLVSWTRSEASKALYDEPGRADADRGAWLASVVATCRAATRATESSPVYAAVKRGVDSLRAHCTEVERRSERCSRKLLFVHSDLRENGDATIYAHLAAATKRPGRRLRNTLAVLPKLDTAGVDLSVCGVSATRTGSNESYVSPDAVSGVWREILGPSAPAFDAACPSDASIAATASVAHVEVKP